MRAAFLIHVRGDRRPGETDENRGWLPSMMAGMMISMSRRSDAAWREMNEPVIAEFRARAGRVSRKHPVILLTTTGARSGRPHVTPLNFSQDGDRLVVVASKGGAAHHPDWYLNLLANPEVTIEYGVERFRARATAADEPERTRLYDQHAAAMPFFDGYRRRVKSRQIPVVVFERLED
jgi:deazaflavin-dependent oxidoreductase (nitroreductase family)